MIDLNGVPVNDEDLIEFFRSCKEADLPPRLQKNYWDAMRSRQAYEMTAGDLFKTDDVLFMVVEMFKDIRSSITLFVDNVERENELTDRQRTAIINLSDDLLSEVRNKILNNKRYANAKTILENETGDSETVFKRIETVNAETHGESHDTNKRRGRPPKPGNENKTRQPRTPKPK